MLYAIAAILLVLWFVGILTTHLLGGLIHLLLVAAIVVLLFGLLSGRRFF